MTKREELYCLLKLYKEGKYELSDFCDELTRILYYESSGINELDNHDQKHFEALGNIAKRYSPYEKDRKAFKWYCDEVEVREAIKIACDNLLKE